MPPGTAKADTANCQLPLLPQCRKRSPAADTKSQKHPAATNASAADRVPRLGTQVLKACAGHHALELQADNVPLSPILPAARGPDLEDLVPSTSVTLQCCLLLRVEDAQIHHTSINHIQEGEVHVALGVTCVDNPHVATCVMDLLGQWSLDHAGNHGGEDRESCGVFFFGGGSRPGCCGCTEQALAASTKRFKGY